MKLNNKITEVLNRLQKGDEVKMTIKKNMTQFQDGTEETLHLVAWDIPSNPESSVTVFWDADADLEGDVDQKDLIQQGYNHVNLQSARRNSTASSRGYKYEIRELMNEEIDASPVVDLERIN